MTKADNEKKRSAAAAPVAEEPPTNANTVAAEPVIDTTKMNIYQKMLAITYAVQAIEKNGYNDYAKYNYVKASDVIAGIQRALVKFQVCLSISELESTDWAEAKEKGGINHFNKTKCRADFINADNPAEKISVDYYGEAADSLDKQIFKAKTGGLKYLLTQQFMLATDVVIDPELENKPAQAPAAQAPGNAAPKGNVDAKKAPQGPVAGSPAAQAPGEMTKQQADFAALNNYKGPDGRTAPICANCEIGVDSATFWYSFNNYQQKILCPDCQAQYPECKVEKKPAGRTK